MDHPDKEEGKGDKEIVNQQAKAEWRACDWVRGRNKGWGLWRVRKTNEKAHFPFDVEIKSKINRFGKKQKKK